MEAEAEAAGRRVVQPDTRAKASKEIFALEGKSDGSEMSSKVFD